MHSRILPGYGLSFKPGQRRFGAEGIADCFADPRYVEKMVLLTDATSNVGGFEHLGDGFLADLRARGMKTATSVDFLA